MGGGGGRKATPGAVKMREKNSIFSMKKQHPKTHTPLYLELLIPLKIMLINYAKTQYFDSILIHFFCASRSILNYSYPSKYCSKSKQKLHISDSILSEAFPTFQALYASQQQLWNSSSIILTLFSVNEILFDTI